MCYECEVALTPPTPVVMDDDDEGKGHGRRSQKRCREESGAATPPSDTELALRAELERLKAENRKLKRRRR